MPHITKKETCIAVNWLNQYRAIFWEIRPWYGSWACCAPHHRSWRELNCGLPRSSMDDLIAVNVVFGKWVSDISLNAVANVDYAEGLWVNSVYSGDTLWSRSEVIRLKQNSNGKSGNVYVRTTSLSTRTTLFFGRCAGFWWKNRPSRWGDDRRRWTYDGQTVVVKHLEASFWQKNTDRR